MGAPFDTAAERYDQEFEQLPATARLRRIVLEDALRFLPPGGSLLELNCGTGTDAVALAREGFTVTATDGSAAMVDRAAEKVRMAEVGGRVTCRQLSFDRITELADGLYDGVFSNMAGLNCIPDHRDLASSLTRLVRPGGFMIAVLLSRVCLWEICSFLIRGQVRSAFRRFPRKGAPVSVHGQPLTVYFHSPGSVARSFTPGFRPVFLRGLNVLTPPPSSLHAYRVLKHGSGILEGVEDLVSTVPPFNRIGDHFLLALERRDD